METFELGAGEVATAVRAGRLRPAGLAEAALDRIAGLDAALNAFVEVRKDASAASRDGGSGPLAGVPVAVKDMFVDEGRAPTVGSKVQASWMEGTAEVIRRLRAAGATIVGYTNLHEWAIGTTSAVTASGPIHNPLDLGRMAGGSSGGSAAAVASGMACAAIGTDAGGSIRIPAACCGVVGFKPTWGSVPVDGWVEGVSVVDHIGPLARSVRDARTMFSVLSGTAVPTPEVRPVRVGIATNLFDGVDPTFERQVRDGIDRLRPHVSGVSEVDLPEADLATYAIGLLLLPHTARLLAAAMQSEPDSFASITRRLLELGLAIEEVGVGCDRAHPRSILAGRRLMPWSFLHFPRLPKALRRVVGKHLVSERQGLLARARAIVGWSKLLSKVDVVVSPTLPGPVPRLDDLRFDLPGGRVPTDQALLRLLGPMNLGGVPSLSMPCGEDADGLPVSLCLTAARGNDALVLAVAEKLERALDRRYADRVATPATLS